MSWHPLAFERRTRGAAPFLFFSAFVLAHPLVFLWLMRTFAADRWREELSAGTVSLVLTFAICHLVCAIAEFFFHRYILHVPAFEAMALFFRKHHTHHALTPIHLDDRGRTIRSRYEVVSAAQDECGTFPLWVMGLLLGGFSPILWALAWLLPGVPIVLGGYAALTLTYYLYESVHVLHHRSYEAWWKPRLDGAVASQAWRALYGFHQAHHANYRCNMNVAGFFGLPVGDWIFGTYKQPEVLLVDDAPATTALIQSLTPTPRWPVSRLDQWATDRSRRHRGVVTAA